MRATRLKKFCKLRGIKVQKCLSSIPAPSQQRHDRPEECIADVDDRGDPIKGRWILLH